jgi:hypothetical protein
MNRFIDRIITKLFRRSARTVASPSVAKGGPTAKAQTNAARETAKRARQAAKLNRRAGR